MVNDIEDCKRDIDFIFRNMNNLNNAEKEVFILTILEEFCKIDFDRKYCPICGNESIFFLPYGEPPRKNALCPNCFSLERHRFFYLFFKKVINVNNRESKCLGINLESKIIDILNEIPSSKYYNLNSNFNKDDLENPLNEYKSNFFDMIVTSDINGLYGHISKIEDLLKNNGVFIFAGESDYRFKLSFNRLKKRGFIITKYSLSDILENKLISKYSVANMVMFVARNNFFRLKRK